MRVISHTCLIQNRPTYDPMLSYSALPDSFTLLSFSNSQFLHSDTILICFFTFLFEVSVRLVFYLLHSKRRNSLQSQLG